uniref:Syntaxin binding protein 6 (amisyn) n=1 Tax=Salarias fasciatus TaxID=181472 RepID=A0A672GG87_SALFA
MSAKSAINKEVFIPHDEKMLAAVQVKRRTKKKIPFLATGGQGDYMTFICLSAVDSVFSRCKVFMNRMRKDFVSHHGRLLRQGKLQNQTSHSVTSAVQKASQALNERGERLGRAEERTADMMNSAEQFALIACVSLSMHEKWQRCFSCILKYV